MSSLDGTGKLVAVAGMPAHIPCCSTSICWLSLMVWYAGIFSTLCVKSSLPARSDYDQNSFLNQNLRLSSLRTMTASCSRFQCDRERGGGMDSEGEREGRRGGRRDDEEDTREGK